MRFTAGGETLIDFGTAETTLAETATPGDAVAPVMVAVPTCRAVTRPPTDVSAAVALDELQRRAFVRSNVLPSGCTPVARNCWV